MTENEAKDILNEIMELDDSMAQYNLAYMKAMEVAINALEEVQKYRAIGTPEECRVAKEKQVDEKPTAVLGTFGGTEYECKNCGSDVCYGDEYCRWCGQKLDWSGVE